MVKARLLKDGSYGSGLEKIQYPVEVEVFSVDIKLDSVRISGAELIRIGGDADEFTPEYPYIFFLGTEAELI